MYKSYTAYPVRCPEHPHSVVVNSLLREKGTHFCGAFSYESSHWFTPECKPVETDMFPTRPPSFALVEDEEQIVLPEDEEEEDDVISRFDRLNNLEKAVIEEALNLYLERRTGPLASERLLAAAAILAEEVSLA